MKLQHFFLINAKPQSYFAKANRPTAANKTRTMSLCIKKRSTFDKKKHVFNWFFILIGSFFKETRKWIWFIYFLIKYTHFKKKSKFEIFHFHFQIKYSHFLRIEIGNISFSHKIKRFSASNSLSLLIDFLGKPYTTSNTDIEDECWCTLFYNFYFQTFFRK